MRTRWTVWAACVLALAAASAPYLYGWLNRPAGSLFYAVPPVNHGDATQYLALARQAEEGHLLLGNPFTEEPHVPRLVLPHVLLEAALSRWGRLGALGAFQATRVAYGAALLAAAWWFGTLLLPRRRQRWLYLGLVLFSAGATWLLERFGLYIPAGDANQPEGNTLFTLGNLPHLCLATALLVVLFGTRLALERPGPGERRRWLVPTFLAALALSWTHPFDFLQLGLGLGLYTAVQWRCIRKLPRAAVTHGLALVLGAAPAAAYNGWLVASDPFYRALANDPLQVQPFAFYAIAHGLLALPALVVLCHRGLRARYALPLCWVIAAFLFLLLPLRLGGKQPRMVGGIHIPLCVLAAAGVDWTARAAVRRRSRAGVMEYRSGGVVEARTRGGAVLRPLRAGYAALAGGYCLLTWTGGWGVLERHVAGYTARDPEPYIVADVRRVLSYLEAHRRPGDLVLAGPFTSGWAPVFAGTTVYHGHWHMTLDSEAKRLERNRMYGGDVSNAERAAWLRRHRITWVILYRGEWEDRPTPFDGVPGVTAALRTPEATLYRVGRLDSANAERMDKARWVSGREGEWARGGMGEWETSRTKPLPLP